MGRLQGKNAIITGAASGIGRAAARVFAEEGARLVLSDVRPLDETVADVEACGGKALAVVGDVSSAELVKSLVSTCVRDKPLR